MVHENPSFSKLSGKVIRKDLYFYLKVLCNCVFDVVIQLAVLVEEMQLVRAEGLEALGNHLLSRYFTLVP